MRPALLLLLTVLLAPGCGDWTFRIPPPAAPPPLPPPPTVWDPLAPQEDDGLWEEVVLPAEPGPLTPPVAPPGTTAPPPLGPGQGGHFGRIPKPYRQRLSEEDAATANGGAKPNAKRLTPWPHVCGSGAIELERERKQRELQRDR